MLFSASILRDRRSGGFAISSSASAPQVLIRAVLLISLIVNLYQLKHDRCHHTRKRVREKLSWNELIKKLADIDANKYRQWNDFQMAQKEQFENQFHQLEEEKFKLNTQLARQWRQELEVASKETTSSLSRQNQVIKEHAVSNVGLKKCQHVFLDFGANKGDSINQLIDALLPEYMSDATLNRYGDSRQFHHSVDDSSGDIGPTFYQKQQHEGNDNAANTSSWSILPQWIQDRIREYNNIKKNSNHAVAPEEYCYYGIEGNPYFASLLLQKELSIASMNPKPLRHVHFLVNHVGASVDGPTVLYLDQQVGGSEQHSYGGSSLFSTHQDVVRSEQVTGETKAVQVTGITLTKLLQETVAPNAGHVMIVMDAEGAEYSILEQAGSILCKLVKEDHVRIDLKIDFHNDGKLGTDRERLRWNKVFKGGEALRECQVNYEWEQR